MSISSSNLLNFNFNDNLTTENFASQGQRIYAAINGKSLSSNNSQVSDTVQQINNFKNAPFRILSIPQTQGALAKLVSDRDIIQVNKDGISLDPVGLVALSRSNIGSSDLQGISSKAVEQTLSKVLQTYQLKKPRVSAPAAQAPVVAPAVVRAPIVAPAPTEKTAPVKDTAPAVIPAPTKKTAPVKDTAPAVIPAPTKKTAPVKDTAPAVIPAPTEKTAPEVVNPEAAVTAPSRKEGKTPEKTVVLEDASTTTEIQAEEVSNEDNVPLLSKEPPVVTPKKKKNFIGLIFDFIGKIFSWFFGLFSGKKKTTVKNTGENAV